MSQKELVQLTGLNQCTVSYLENGHQEVAEQHLEKLRTVFPEVDMESYIYDRETHLPPEKIRMDKSYTHNIILNGDWSLPSPLEITEGMRIICRMGRILVSAYGDILLNKNDGSFSHQGYYVISHRKLEDPCIIQCLSQKEWFDAEMYEDFKRAYFIGCKIADTHPMKQLRPDEIP